MAPNNNYPYPAPGQIPYPVTTAGLSDAEYKRKQIAAEKKRRTAGMSGFAASIQNRLFDQQRPLQTIFSSLGLGGLANNRITGYLDTYNPVAASFRVGDELSQGNFKQAASEGIRTAGAFIPGGIVRSVLGGLGADFVAGRLENKNQNGVPFTTGSLLPGRSYTMTPAQQAAMAAANQNRTDAAGNSGMGGRRVVSLPSGSRPSGGFPGAVAATPAAPATPAALPALLPLTPDQQSQYGEEMSAINNLYKQTLAQLAQEGEQGQLDYARVGQSAQRQAAGSAQDIASQMASSGLADSPASAFGAEQMVQAPLVQQRQANRLNLNQLLAQIQKQKTQAGTAMDMSKVGLNRLIAAQRAANTASQVNAGYQNFLGGM